MPHWPFVIAAYGLTLVGTAGVVLWARIAMIRAEAKAAQLGGGR
ncbi:MAG: hypothetical protein U5M50_05395 [Sphingobium sp.]|nr:hypothetical protein [Sphingobium sp.]